MSTDPQTEKPTQVEGPTSHVDEALAKAEVQVESLESAPFSPTAFKLLVGSISEYAQDLTTESAKTARRHKLDTVSSTHVIQAQQ